VSLGAGNVGQLDGSEVHGFEHRLAEHVFVVVFKGGAFCDGHGLEFSSGVFAAGSAVVDFTDECFLLHGVEHVITNVHVLARDGKDVSKGVHISELGEFHFMANGIFVLVGGQGVFEDVDLFHVPVEDNHVAPRYSSLVVPISIFCFEASLGGLSETLAETPVLDVHEFHGAVHRILEVVQGLYTGGTTDFHDGALGATAG